MKDLTCKCILFLLIVIANATQGQTKSVDYSLQLPKEKYSNSLYNELKVYDARERKTDLGIVQKGMFNAKRLVVPTVPITTQIEDLFKNSIDSTAKEGKLILQLIKFDLAELTGGLSEKGYFDIRAIIYENKNGTFATIASLDEKIVVSGIDVTNALKRKSSQVLANFIHQSLNSLPKTDEALTADDLINIDLLLKNKLPLYTNENLIDGVFKDWESFKNQIPSYDILTKLDKKGNIIEYNYLDAAGKKKKINYKDVYAFTLANAASLVTKHGNYPIFKSDTDFMFDGFVLETVNAGNLIGPSIAIGIGFGAIGGLLMMPTYSPQKELYRLKIDPFDGSFIKISKFE